jgi:hypothetical protein
MKNSALGKLINTLKTGSHDLRPSTEVFADLDVNRLAVEMELEKRGRERGEKEEPASASSTLDETESQIVEKVLAERKASHALLEDQLGIYGVRLTNLDFDDRFSAIRQAAPACLAQFKAEVVKGRNRLHPKRRQLKEVERERDIFRERHRLDRVARVQTGGHTFFKWALIVLLLLIETIANGVFLAKGSEQGLLGGTTEAATFAFLNIGSALLLAKVGVVELNHRSLMRRFFGLVALCVYAGIALALNLSIAHYREASALLLEGGGQEVIRRMTTAPFELAELNSWILFGVGLLFSLIAFIDGLVLSDPYPGYSGVEHRLRAAQKDYADEIDLLVDELGEIRDEFRDEMEELSRDLSVRRGEHDAIILHRNRLLQLFNLHEQQLERAGAALLEVYRDANRQARSTKPPKRFAAAWRLERLNITLQSLGEWDRDELRRSIKETQDLLTAEVQAIHHAYTDAIQGYQNMDDIVQERQNGKAATVAA